MTAEISKEIGLIDAVPPLQALAGIKPFKWLNQRAKLTGTITPQLSFDASFAQQGGELRFRDGAGKLEVGLNAKLAFKPLPRITAEAKLGGTGSFTLGVPEPLVRELQVGLEASARITFDYIFGLGGSITKRYAARCVWPVTDGQLCRRSDDSSNFAEDSFDLTPDRLPVSLIQPDYERFGAYSFFQPTPLLKIASAATPVSAQETTLVQNIFPGAVPAITPAGNGQIVLWEQQDTSLPVLQSTDIAWSYNDGNGWSAPALIAHDTQTELAPVGGTDQNGKVVAAWLRIKDPVFATPLNTVADLPLFYNKLEVVSASFDPLSRSWGPVRQLTDDAALDTNLRMSSDGAGRLLLTWLSNPQGEFISTASSPATIKFSFWDGANWSAPAAVVNGLVGVSSHAAAVKGTNAFIIVPREPNPDLPSDGVLELYRWNGAQWSAATSFAAGGVENRSPAVSYDAAGEGHIVWVRGADLVHATLSQPVPEVVRAGSNGLGFYDAKLLINPQGNLTLVWQQVADNGPANLFAVVYDAAAGTWSADRRLTESAALAYDFAGYYNADGLLRGVYLSTEIRRTMATVLFGGQPQTISNIPENGPTELRVFEHSLIVDLAVSDKDLTLDAHAPQPGEAVTALLNVHNAGDFAVGSFSVNLYAGGAWLSTDQVAGPLAAGGSRIVTFHFTYPAGGGDLVAVVDADEVITEFSEANNRAALYLTNTAPQARLATNVTGGLAPLTVAFDASGSFDAEGEALSFSWAFADGSPSASGMRLSHIFTQPGSYPVTVTVTDARGAVGIVIVTINVVVSRPVTTVSAASYNAVLAPEIIVAAFGSALANTTKAVEETPLPIVLDGVSVRVRDSAGTERLAQLFFISPTQINHQIPAGTATGAATITISNGDVAIATGTAQIAAVAPGLFTADASGRGIPAAVVLRIKANGAQSFEPVARFDPAQNRLVAVPIDLGPATEQVFLLLFGTGIRFNSGLAAVTSRIGGVNAEVTFAGAQGSLVGLDQINQRLPRNLAGRGEVEIVLTVDGHPANTVRVGIK
ncbi:MAG: PKD domain-containing protein [Acidobacteria bacterium]|nr:PKD domain-containing protein [Acidobacteriota bacterium]